MSDLTLFIWLAGGLQLLMASVNFFAPRVLHYRENLARVDQTFRDVFVIHCVYTALILVAFAALCFGFAGELTSGTLLGRCVCGFLAVFWGLRVFMQMFHYNTEIKRKYPVFNVLFLVTFVILTAIFTAATLW